MVSKRRIIYIMYSFIYWRMVKLYIHNIICVFPPQIIKIPFRLFIRWCNKIYNNFFAMSALYIGFVVIVYIAPKAKPWRGLA